VSVFRLSSLEGGIREGDNPVSGERTGALRCVLDESSCLGMQLQMGGKFHLKLNIGERPIANKYREGKMKRTLKRELKVPEIASMEAIETGYLRGGLGGDFRSADLLLTSSL